MKTVGEILDILEQFPRDQLLEIGIVTHDDIASITCLPIEDILISEKHLVIVDSETSQLLQEQIRNKLNLRKKKETEEEDATPSDVDEVEESQV